MKADGPRNIDWRPWIELRVVNGRYEIMRLVQKVADKQIVFYLASSIVDPGVPGCESTHEHVIELVGWALAQVSAAQ
jgi:hypothetical protein